MSKLPNSNREVAEEWLRRAAWRHTTGVRALAETGDTTDAVRDFASAAELAPKAVYIKLGSLFPRTHNVSELVEEYPDRYLRPMSRNVDASRNASWDGRRV